METKRKRVQLNFKKPSRTKQAFKDEVDVNRILAKYQKTMQLTHVNKIQGTYGDFSSVSDYQSSLNAISDAHTRFMGLPAAIRKKFDNDPSKLLNYVSNPNNYDDAVKSGLIPSKETTPTPTPEDTKKGSNDD